MTSVQKNIGLPVRVGSVAALLDCWISYTHQQTWMQYPVTTAKEERMATVLE